MLHAPGDIFSSDIDRLWTLLNCLHTRHYIIRYRYKNPVYSVKIIAHPVISFISFFYNNDSRQKKILQDVILFNDRVYLNNSFGHLE